MNLSNKKKYSWRSRRKGFVRRRPQDECGEQFVIRTQMLPKRVLEQKKRKKNIVRHFWKSIVFSTTLGVVWKYTWRCLSFVIGPWWTFVCCFHSSKAIHTYWYIIKIIDMWQRTHKYTASKWERDCSEYKVDKNIFIAKKYWQHCKDQCQHIFIDFLKQETPILLILPCQLDQLLDGAQKK